MFKKMIVLVIAWYASNALYTALPVKFKPPFKDTE
jgi:hypothetical protein